MATNMTNTAKVILGGVLGFCASAAAAAPVTLVIFYFFYGTIYIEGDLASSESKFTLFWWINVYFIIIFVLFYGMVRKGIKYLMGII